MYGFKQIKTNQKLKMFNRKKCNRRKKTKYILYSRPFVPQKFYYECSRPVVLESKKKKNK